MGGGRERLRGSPLPCLGPDQTDRLTPPRACARPCPAWLRWYRPLRPGTRRSTAPKPLTRTPRQGTDPSMRRLRALPRLMSGYSTRTPRNGRHHNKDIAAESPKLPASDRAIRNGGSGDIAAAAPSGAKLRMAHRCPCSQHWAPFLKVGCPKAREALMAPRLFRRQCRVPDAGGCPGCEGCGVGGVWLRGATAQSRAVGEKSERKHRRGIEPRRSRPAMPVRRACAGRAGCRWPVRWASCS